MNAREFLERRLIGLKKRIEELQSEVDVANGQLEDSKHLKEATEQKLKGYEVELALNEASTQALEARISLIRSQISTVGDKVEALKNEEQTLSDRFIGQMFELNAKIRKFRETIGCSFQKENGTGTAAEERKKISTINETEITSRNLEDMLAQVLSQIAKAEEEYLVGQDTQKQVQLELTEYERNVSMMEVIMKETRELQDLTRYPYNFFQYTK